MVEVDRPNVLVSSAARKVLLVRAFRDALDRCGGGRVIAADINPTAAAMYAADDARIVPPSDDPRFVEALLELCDRDRVGLLIPTRDEELPILAAARTRFAEAGTLVLVSSPDAIETCQDKVRFAEAVRSAGLRTPEAYADGAQARFPAFVKPRRGKGGRGTAVVRDRAELAGALAALDGDGVIQAFVDMPEFTIDTFLDLDGRAISCVPRERMSIVGGESFVARTVHDEDLVEATLKLCGSIALVGHVTAQAFRTTEDILFIEVNPRFGGAANLGFMAGPRTPEFAIRAARGERLTPRLGDYEVGLVMLRYHDDLFVREGDLMGMESAP